MKTMLAVAAFLLVANLPAVAAQGTHTDADGWLIVIEDVGAANSLPPLFNTYRGQLAVKDLGSHIGVQFDGLGEPGVEELAMAPVQGSEVRFSLFRPFEDSDFDHLRLRADADGFHATLFDIQDNQGPSVDAGFLVVEPGSTAWDYEVHIDRRAFQPDESYYHGESLWNFEYTMYNDDAEAASGESADPNANLVLSGAGGMDFGRLGATPRWVPYYVRANAMQTDLETRDGDAVLAFVMEDADAEYFDRQTDEPGLRVATLRDGRVSEELVERFSMKIGHVPNLPVRLLDVDGVWHILYTHEIDEGELYHAYQRDGGWTVEPVGVKANRTFDAASRGGELAVIVREDTRAEVLQWSDGAWARLHSEPAVTSLSIAFDVDGTIVASGTQKVPEGRGGYLWRERDAWAKETVWPADRDGNAVDVDLAGVPNGVCVAYKHQVERNQPGLFLRCPGQQPEAWPFAFESPLVDLSALADGRLVVQTGGLMGLRANDGSWWWEKPDMFYGHAHFGVVGDVLVSGGDVNGGFSGTAFYAQAPAARKDPLDAFYTGRPEGAASVLDYRGIVEGPPTTEHQETVAPAKAAVQTSEPAAASKDSPGAPVGFLVALVLLVVALRRK